MSKSIDLQLQILDPLILVFDHTSVHAFLVVTLLEYFVFLIQEDECVLEVIYVAVEDLIVSVQVVHEFFHEHQVISVES